MAEQSQQYALTTAIPNIIQIHTTIKSTHCDPEHFQISEAEQIILTMPMKPIQCILIHITFTQHAASVN